MSTRYVLHVVPAQGRWAVKEQGREEPLSVHPTKTAAVEAAKERARSRPPSQVIVHRADGTIEEEFTYGSDPYPPAG